MLRRWSVPCIAGMLMFMALATPAAAESAQEGLPSKVDASCTKCHEDYEKMSGVIAGKFADVSSKAKTIGVQVNKDMEVVHFDDSTTLENAPSFKEIPKQESVKITYAKKDGKNVATKVEVKKGLAVPKEQLMSAKELQPLVARGPDKGKYILIDSRPATQYNEGHIPTAVSMPFFAFDKMAGDLLKNKDTLQIYYCAGFS